MAACWLSIVISTYEIVLWKISEGNVICVRTHLLDKADGGSQKYDLLSSLLCTLSCLLHQQN